jgi:hypothetical protein
MQRPHQFFGRHFFWKKIFFAESVPQVRVEAEQMVAFDFVPLLRLLIKENALDDVSGAEEDVVLGRLPSRTPSWGHLDVFGHR